MILANKNTEPTSAKVFINDCLLGLDFILTYTQPDMKATQLRILMTRTIFPICPW